MTNDETELIKKRLERAVDLLMNRESSIFEKQGDWNTKIFGMEWEDLYSASELFDIMTSGRQRDIKDFDRISVGRYLILDTWPSPLDDDGIAYNLCFENSEEKAIEAKGWQISSGNDPNMSYDIFVYDLDSDNYFKPLDFEINISIKKDS